MWSSLIFAERDDLEIELRAVQADPVGLQRRMRDAQQALATARPLILCGLFLRLVCAGKLHGTLSPMHLTHREVRWPGGISLVPLLLFCYSGFENVVYY